MAVDETNFPDDNFRSYISGNLDKDGDGSLSDEEIAAVTNIDVSGKSISSLKGIEWFAALETLHCSGNSLTELDVSNNTTLTTLYCNYNQLPALDVSKNTTLTTLYCYSNQLTELDLSNNTDLTYLWCHNNRLTELDVSKNTALTQLRCYDNQLTALDLSNNTALTTLYCYSNQLTELDLSNNTDLTYLWCHNNRLTELDVSKNTALTQLRCYDNQLTALDLSNNTALTTLECKWQEVSGSSIIYTADASYPYKLNNLPNISDVEAKDSSGAEISADYSDGTAQFSVLPATVTYYYATGRGTNMDVTISGLSAVIEVNAAVFPDEKFLAYVSGNFDTDNDGYLIASEITAATNINVSGQGISSLKGIEHFTALTALNCSGNQLTELDLSENTALTALNCSDNQLTELDLSNNTALASLNCGGNQITALDIRDCPSPPSSVNADPAVQITHCAQDGFPSFGKHSLVLSGQLGLDFLLTVPQSTNTAGSYVTFTVNGKEGTPEMFSNLDSSDILSNDTYRFTSYTSSVQMADEIQAVYVYSGDYSLASVQEFTVKDYLDTIVASTDLQAKSPNLVALANAIKDYGHYVQIPLADFNSWEYGVKHSSMDCADENIASDSSDIAAKLTSYALSRDKSAGINAGITGLQYDLELDSETTLNVYLSPDSEAGTVQAYITDDEGEYDGKTDMAAYNPSTGEYSVSIAGISAHKLGKTYTISVKTSKGEFPVKVSALSYADGVMKSDTVTDDLKRAVIALYKYYAATMKYRGTPVDGQE